MSDLTPVPAPAPRTESGLGRAVRWILAAAIYGATAAVELLLERFFGAGPAAEVPQKIKSRIKEPQ